MSNFEGLKQKLESIFAIDSYESGNDETSDYDTINVTNKRTGKKSSIIKDEPIYENENTFPEEQKTICIDFDGVLHPYDSWNDGKLNPNPLSGAKEAIDKLKNKFKIVIYTTRASASSHNPTERNEQIKNIEQWLTKHNIPFDEITGDKVGAVAYIDDRAIRFENNWPEVFAKLQL